MTITSCESEYNLSIVAPKKVILNDKVEISLNEENDFPIEEVTFFVNGNEILTEKKSFILDTKEYGTGKLIISAMVAYGDHKSKRVNNSIEVFSNTPLYLMDIRLLIPTHMMEMHTLKD